jgi:hypothetical protein
MQLLLAATPYDHPNKASATTSFSTAASFYSAPSPPHQHHLLLLCSRLSLLPKSCIAYRRAGFTSDHPHFGYAVCSASATACFTAAASSYSTSTPPRPPSPPQPPLPPPALSLLRLPSTFLDIPDAAAYGANDVPVPFRH